MGRYRTEKIRIPTKNGMMKMLIICPKKSNGKAPGVLWIHGGGYETGMPSMIYFSRGIDLVKKFGAVVIAPKYTLSGKAPYPAALEDCYEALLYLRNHTDELGINPDQIMVGGESAGGGMTAAICMYARDKGEVNIAYQMPIYPMIDDRYTDSSRDNHAPVWNTKRNDKAWRKYLRDLYRNDPPPYAAPARQTDYKGLPPAYSFVGDRDPFYCETLTYIENLKNAGIEASADVYPDCFHSFDLFLIFSKKTKAAKKKFEEHFEYALKNYRAPQRKGEEYETD